MPCTIVVRNNLRLDRFNLENNFRTYFQSPELLVSAKDGNELFPSDTYSLELCHNFLADNSMFNFLKNMNKSFVDYLNRFYSISFQDAKFIKYEVVEYTI